MLTEREPVATTLVRVSKLLSVYIFFLIFVNNNNNNNNINTDPKLRMRWNTILRRDMSYDTTSHPNNVWIINLCQVHPIQRDHHQYRIQTEEEKLTMLLPRTQQYYITQCFSFIIDIFHDFSRVLNSAIFDFRKMWNINFAFFYRI